MVTGCSIWYSKRSPSLRSRTWAGAELTAERRSCAARALRASGAGAAATTPPEPPRSCTPATLALWFLVVCHPQLERFLHRRRQHAGGLLHLDHGTPDVARSVQIVDEGHGQPGDQGQLDVLPILVLGVIDDGP